jgi:hypothetical protein
MSWGESSGRDRDAATPHGTRAFAFEAELELAPGTDTRAPGGAVTVALCGHWDHEGPCRWPHNSRIDTSAPTARLRTIVVSDDETVDEVITRVESALRHDSRWSVVATKTDTIRADERSLAEGLAGSG